MMSSRDIFYARFVNWTRDLGNHIEPSDFTVRIKTLELSSPRAPVHYFGILPLLKSCVNLSTLSIGNVIGAYVKDFDTDMDTSLDSWMATYDQGNPVWFPNLETFKFIDNWAVPSASVGSYAQGCCQRKSEFIAFLFKKLSLTKLKRLQVEFHNSFWWISLRDLFTLVEPHQFETIGQSINGDENGDPQIFSKESRYKTLVQLPLRLLGKTLATTLNFVEIQYHTILTVQCQFHTGNFAINGIRQLSRFKSFISKDASEGKCGRLNYLQAQEIHNLWADVLNNSQFSLKEFDGEQTFDTPDHLLPILTNNVCTLQNTRILTTLSSPQLDEDDDVVADEDALWDQIDFRRFQKQQKLTHLSFIVDKISPSNVELCDAHPFFRHIKDLPDSLVYLEMSCPIHLTIKDEGDNGSLGFCDCLGHLKNLKELILWNTSYSSELNSPWFVVNNSKQVTMIKPSHIEAFIINFPNLVSLHFNWTCTQESKNCCECSCDLCTTVQLQEEEEGSSGSKNICDAVFDKEIFKMEHVKYYDPSIQTQVIKRVKISDGKCVKNAKTIVPTRLCVNIITS